MTSLGELAGHARRYAAVERRLFEVLGGWVPSVPEAEAKLLLRAHSFQHAWHADLWDGLAPRTGPAAEAGGGPWADDLLGPLAAASTTVDRLGAAYGLVLPGLVGEYTDLRRRAQPPSDAPLLRVVRLILADDEPAIAAGQSLLQVVVGTTEVEGETDVAGRMGTEAASKP